MNLWRINLKPANKIGYDSREYCLENNIVGIGWPLDDITESVTSETYEIAGKIKYQLNAARGWSKAWNAIYYKMKIDDLVWTRTTDGNYFLGRVISEWRYDFSSDAINHDIANVRDCEWIEVGLVDKVPGKVVRAFMLSSTLQRVEGDDTMAYSQQLYNNLSNTTFYQPELSLEKDIFSLLSPDDCEDVVGLFLQIKQGYLMIPSSCKRDTVGYEYELIHRLTGEKAVVQVKSGNVSLNRNDFEQIDANVFLFTTNQEYHGEEQNNIICLDSKVLKEFMYEYPNLLPEKVRFWTSNLINSPPLLMIHLLIDNCNLLRIVHREGFNSNLSKLTTLINEGFIKLYCHELVLEEWKNHEVEDFQRKLKTLKKKAKNSNSIDTVHLKAQYHQIYQLLCNAQSLTTPIIILNDVGRRRRERRAPYVQKLDSDNDWEIFGSFANYGSINGLSDLYFLSENHSDFGNGKLGEELSIHPHFVEDFPQLRIHYFINFNELLSEIDDLKISNSYIPNHFVNENFNWQATCRKNILESLHYLLADAFKNVRFIPLPILLKYYPFKDSDESVVFMRQNTVYGVCESLVNFFNNLRYDSDGTVHVIDESLVSDTDDYYNKIVFVIRRLLDNLIYAVSPNVNGAITLLLSEHQPIESSDKLVSDFKYHEHFKKLSIEEDKLDQTLEVAFLNFQFGDFDRSEELFYKIHQKASTLQNGFISFISTFNIKQIGTYLSHPLVISKSDNLSEKITETKKINLFDLAFKYKDTYDYSVMLYIASNNFFSDAFEKIVELSSNLEDRYNSRTTAGFNQSNDILNLQNEFLKLESFLNRNYILYDNYSDFDRLFDHVVKSIFISYSLPENYTVRFEHFDDEWLSKIVKYGNRKNIIKYFLRFKIKSLRYSQSDFYGESFVKILVNIFNIGEYSSLHENIGFRKNFFLNKHNNYVENALTLASILELDEKQILTISSHVLHALKNNPLITPNLISGSLRDFLSRHGNKIASSILKSYFKFFLSNEKFHNCKLLKVIIEKIPFHEKLSISKVKVSNLIHSNDNGVCGSYLSKLALATLYSKVDSKTKKYIEEIIITRTKTSEVIDVELLTIAVSLDAIKVGKRDIDKALKQVNLDHQEVTFESLFSEKQEKRIKQIDGLLNLYFKFRFSTTGEIFEQVKLIDPYYAWLLDMEKFDYDYFKIEWVTYYETVFYKRHISKSTALKKYLFMYIAENDNNDIQQLYFKLYIQT